MKSPRCARVLRAMARLAIGSFGCLAGAEAAPVPGEVRVVVVEKADSKPASDAEVIWLESRVIAAETERRGRMLTVSERDDLLREHGAHLNTNARGEVTFETDGGLLVESRRLGHWAQSQLEKPPQEPLRLELDTNLELRVLVTDASGKPVPDLPVRMERVMEMEREFPSWALEVELTHGDGVARFPHVQNQLGGGIEELRFVPSIPLATRVSRNVTVRNPPADALRIELPPTGSVVLRMPGVPDAHASLQLESPFGVGPRMSRDLQSVAFVDGEARFPFVGLGTKLVAEINATGLAESMRKSLEGPKAAGEVVTATIGAAADVVSLRGVAVDEDGRPLAKRELMIDLTISCVRAGSSSSGSKGSSVTTDAEGRFALTIARKGEEGCSRTLTIRPDWRKVENWRRETEPAAYANVPAAIEAAGVDLGTLRLCSISSPRRFETTNDDDLMEATRVALNPPGQQPPRQLEALLTEMGRRGGKRFQAFLTEELDKPILSSKQPGSDVEDQDLCLLCALRRVQRAQDPLELRIASSSVLVTEFPSSPVFHAQLVNADAGGASFHAANGGGYRSGRLEHWTVDVRKLDGTRLEPRAWSSGMGGGLYTHRLLAPGEMLEVGIMLSNYVIIAEPGEYEARLLHHETESIAGEKELGNLICWTSKWTRIKIEPRTIRLTKDEDQRARSAVAALSDTGPVKIYIVTYDSERAFTAQPQSSEEMLLSLGWRSLPALFSALDDPARTLSQRAHVLGQLYNLTGLHDPSVEYGVVGNSERVGGPLDEGKSAATIFLSGQNSFGEIDASKQRAFALRWKDSAKGFRFEFVDAGAGPK